MTEDEITNAFDAATVADFGTAETTATQQMFTSHKATGAKGFDFFTQYVIRQALQHFAQHGAEMPVWAALETDTEVRLFNPAPGETIKDFFQRLRSEGQAMEAEWFGLAMVTTAAVAESESQVPDVDAWDGDAIRAATARGVLASHMIAYAESRTEGVRCTAWPVGDTGLGGPVVGADTRSPLLASVLAP